MRRRFSSRDLTRLLHRGLPPLFPPPPGPPHRIVCAGLPDSVRPAYWKILLGVLPADVSRWDSIMEKNEKLYQDWVRDLMLDPSQHSRCA